MVSKTVVRVKRTVGFEIPDPLRSGPLEAQGVAVFFGNRATSCATRKASLGLAGVPWRRFVEGLPAVSGPLCEPAAMLRLILA